MHLGAKAGERKIGGSIHQQGRIGLDLDPQLSIGVEVETRADLSLIGRGGKAPRHKDRCCQALFSEFDILPAMDHAETIRRRSIEEKDIQKGSLCASFLIFLIVVAVVVVLVMVVRARVLVEESISGHEEADQKAVGLDEIKGDRDLLDVL